MPRLRAALIAAAGLCAVGAPSAHAIVGGTDVPPGKRDYVALIIIDNAFQCTGTLAAPDVVITAGHCSSISPGPAVPLSKPGLSFDVTLASVDADGEGGEKVDVSEVVVHPQYSEANLLLGDRGEESSVSNDVAVLKLSEPSQQTPVPIANASEKGLWTAGKTAQIAGFGTTESGGDTPDVMQEAEVNIDTDERSAAAYEGSFEPETQIGASAPGRDTCQGDSGGPLIVPTADGRSLRLVGDTSYGNGCADPEFPGIYGRIADDELRPFLEEEAPQAIAGNPGSSPGPVIESPGAPVDSGGSPQPQPSPSPGGGGSSEPSPTPTPTPSPAPAPTASSAATAPFAVSAALDRRRLRRALSRGVRLRVRSSQAANVAATLRLGSRTVARGTLSGLTGRRTFSLRFTPAGRRALARRRSARLTLSVRVAGRDGQTRTVTRRITLRR